MIHSTSLNTLKELIRQNHNRIDDHGTLVPVIEEHLADLDTPVSVYSRILGNPHFKNSFVFESAEGINQNARYSFIGFNPFLKFTIEKSDAEIEIIDPDFKWAAENKSNNPLEILKNLLRSFTIIRGQETPRLSSGAIGYIGYDSIRLVENIPFEVEKDQKLPTAMLGFYNQFIVFDNLKKTMVYVYAPLVKKESDIEAVFDKAQSMITQIRSNLAELSTKAFKPFQKKIDWQSNMSEGTFRNIVEQAKEYIAAGDIFQVVLSQKFTTKFDGDPFAIYRILRIINPSPYLYFIDFDDVKILGSSPELLVRIDDGHVYTRPIAGTRPRGRDSDEDKHFEQDLLSDKKELAEHLMLVDLGRNDLGKVCNFGSVHVSRMMSVEHYSHVMHIVSDVTGSIRDECDPVDALFATFPAGTLSGAPKIRAMEIIDELEPTERAVYGGAIGYFDFSGNMDWCIAIRTIVLNKNLLSVQAGAGIVADSIPQNEFEETMNKSQALKSAVEWAGSK